MSITIEVLEKYKNISFVETGTYLGETVLKAISLGFTNIYSIELSKELYNQNLEKFKEYSNVNLYCGDSSDILYNVTKKINGNITFWLDGHYSGGNTAKGKKTYPIVEELKKIKKLKNKNNTILIDDIRFLGDNYKKYPDLINLNEDKKKEFLYLDVTENDVIKLLLKINKNYKFKYEDGHVPNDILVAYI